MAIDNNIDLVVQGLQWVPGTWGIKTLTIESYYRGSKMLIMETKWLKLNQGYQEPGNIKE